MPEPKDATPTSPFASILNWSTDKVDWQRDALRRIVESGPLSPEAITELAAICRAKHGLFPTTGAAPTAVPLAAAHMPGGADATDSVSLSKLSGLQNVGRLPNDQEIAFGNAPGLTVIYGENGAGKSGYARVIKKACRARGTPQDIKPDAFAAGATGPAKARINYRVGTVDTPVDWTDGSAADPRLGNIFVFDSLSARLHVGEDGPACFKPRGLDVLPELAKACDTIKAELQAEIDAEYKKIKDTRDGWGRNGPTAVAKLVNSIDVSTDPARIEAAALFTDADEKRLAEIIATLSTGPKFKAAETTAAAKRIRTFAETAKSRAVSLDDTAMQRLGEAIKEAETTAKAAKAAAGPELKDSDLPGSCNEVWRKLWDAAKAYSVAHAYPGKAFPATEADAKCVLCQQTLQPEAIDRCARFNRFVADETRKQAEAAKARVADLKKGVDPLRAIGTEAADIKVDLDREAAGTFAEVEAFAKAIDVRITHAQRCLRDGSWTDAPALPVSPSAELVKLADLLDMRAKEEEAAADPKKKQELEKERDELTDKKWLAGKKEECKAQIGRYQHAAKLEKCRDDCTTNAITIKSGELHETYVTEKFSKAFENELAALGMKTLSVTLEVTKGTKGERKFGVRLVDRSKIPPVTLNAKVGDIASEGEHRCIALAAFMAELSQASHKSALVFDDPVSSLDQLHRLKIAERLVAEAAVRQVVLFVHDILFVHHILSLADKARLTPRVQSLEWFDGKPGKVTNGLSWDCSKPKERLADLRQIQEDIARRWNPVPNSKNIEDMREAYTKLRATMEAIVEREVLAGVVCRFETQVYSGKLKKLLNITPSEIAEAERIFKRCHETTQAHYTAPGMHMNIPDPTELLRDIDAAEALRKGAASRNQA